MVKALTSVLVLFCLTTGTAQTLSIGVRFSSGIGSNIELGAPRDYYMTVTSRYLIRTSGEADMEINSFMPPEMFVRYQSRNRFFMQLGAAFVATRQLTFYGLDPEVEAKYNPNAGANDWIWGVVPDDHIGTRIFYFTPNITANYILTKGTTVKPYVGLGLSPFILQSSNMMSDSPEDSVMFKDFGEQKKIALHARAVAGIQYYGLHLDFHVMSNITPIVSASDPYEKRVTTFYVAFGYTFLNFNLTKKKRS